MHTYHFQIYHIRIYLWRGRIDKVVVVYCIRGNDRYQLGLCQMPRLYLLMSLCLLTENLLNCIYWKSKDRFCQSYNGIEDWCRHRLQSQTHKSSYSFPLISCLVTEYTWMDRVFL